MRGTRGNAGGDALFAKNLTASFKCEGTDKFPHRRSSAALFASLLLGTSLAAITATPAAAADTWSGTSSINWSDAANWNNAPANGDDIVIAQTGTNAPSNYNLNLNFKSLTLNATTDAPTEASGYIISNGGSGTFGLLSGGIITDNSGNAGTDQLNMGITLNGPATINVDAGSSLSIGGTGITGTGDLTVDNASTSALLFLANNNYTGGTTITAGTLQLGNGGTTGMIAGNVADNGTLVFDRKDNITFSGAISGTGAVTKLDGDTLILTGTNTYTGGTTITAGTLQIGNGTTVGTISSTGGITDNSHLVFDHSDDITYSGSITGSGDLTQAGGGVLTLSGTSLYSGGTTINAGEISISADANLGSPTGGIAINNASTLDVSAGFTTARNIALGAGTEVIQVDGAVNDTFIVTGAITGNGALNKTGAGTLVVTANDTYSGGTTISAGALQLGNGGATGMVTGDIVDNGSLLFDRSDASLTYGNVISGTGRMTEAETAAGDVLILTADNTYTGGTFVSKGILQLGNGGTTGIVVGTNDTTMTTGVGIALGNGTSVVFDHSNDITYAGDIAGGGSLVQEGADTLTLTGNNFLSGGTTINLGSALQIGDGGTAGSLSGDIADNGELIIDLANPTSTILSGTITGTGSFSQIGTGTTIITGADSYGGGTTVSAGTLQIGLGGTTGSITGDITDNATLAINHSDTITIDGDITGSGTLNQMGVGTTILTGTDAYASTMISAGTLQIGAGSTAGSITGSVSDGSILAFDRSDAVGFSGAISGIGQVNQISAGTLTLSGSNTYSGGTNVSNGTLAVTSQSNLGSGTVSLTNNASLEFLGGGSYSLLAALGTGGGTFNTNGNNVTWSGTISVTGNALTKTGSGSLILTGANTYTGGTTISGGALQIGNGGTAGSIGGAITDNATLDFDHSNDIGFSGIISGSGDVEQLGSGVLTLSGVNTYTGGTNVNAGTLSISSDANLGNGGTLAMAAGTTLKITASGTFGHAVTLIGDPTFNVASGTTTVWSGLISDGGSPPGELEITGGGTFNPTNGLNSYSGGTVVKGGSTLSIASAGDGVLGATSGGLTLGDATTSGILSVTSGFTLASGRTVSLGAGGGTITTAASQTFKIGQGIGGTGALTVGGAGTLLLTGTSSYTGGTTLAAGSTLKLGDGTTAGTILNNVSTGTGSSLIFDEGSDQTFSGIVSGSGTLTQNDTSGHTLTLTAGNTYTGLTTITSGTLQLGGTAGSVAGNIADNDTLAFDRSNTLIEGGTITGSGAVKQIGSGITILTGTDTYSGGTTISAGTLQIGNGGSAGSITGDIEDDATLTIDRTGTITFDGLIGGSGVLNQTGTGITILTDDDTYSGATTISAGTLQLGNGGTTGSVTSAITDNGILAFDRSDPLTYSAVITGTGSLKQIGSGELTLTGANTYGGGTTIGAGSTLRLGDGTTAGTILNNVSTGTGSSLIFDEGTNLTFGGIVSGTGSLTQDDTSDSTLILTGLNTYTGGTTITAGTLQIGNGTTTGAITGDVDDETGLVFDNPGSSTVGGAITGAGSFTQMGAGTTILTGANTYSGGTTISSGTLQIGNGGSSGAITGAVADNGLFIFDLSSAQTFGGAITGTGAVDQNGSGTETLTGTSTYSGATTVNLGTLLVNGSIADSDVTALGGTIGGTGAVKALAVSNGGTVAPGVAGAGTLTVGGNLSLTAGSTYLYDVTSTTTHDLLDVTGTASLGGTLTVNPTGITTPSSNQYAVVTSTGALSGMFSNIDLAVGAPSNLLPIVIYKPNEADLEFVASVESSLPVGATSKTNPGQIAAAIDFAILHDNALVFLPLTSLAPDALSERLAQMSGEEATAVQNVAVQSMDGFLQTMLDPAIGGRGGLGDGGDAFALDHPYARDAYNGRADETPYSRPSQRATTLWGSFEGGTSKTDGVTEIGSHDVSTTQLGGVIGLDYRPRDGEGALGIALGLNQQNWKLAQDTGKGSAKTYQVGAYYSRRWDKFYFTSGLAYARYDATTDREVDFNDGIDHYHAAFTPWSAAMRTEFGRVFQITNGQITPYVRFEAQDLGVPHYFETAVGSSDPQLALSYESKAHFDYKTELGSAWDTVLSARDGMATDLHARVGWLHDFAGELNDTAAFSAFNGASFTVTGARPYRDAAHLELGLEQDIRSVALTLNADGSVSGVGDSYGGTAAISYRW